MAEEDVQALTKSLAVGMTKGEPNRRDIIAAGYTFGAVAVLSSAPAEGAEREAQQRATVHSLRIAQSTEFSAGLKAIFLECYAVPGDGGGAIYSRVPAEPSHMGKLRSLDRLLPEGGVDETNGGWWELQDPVIDPRMFGAVCDGVTDDTNAVRAAASMSGFPSQTTPPGSYNSGSAVYGSRTLRFSASSRRRSTYLVSGEVHLYTGACVTIDKGAELRAAANFVGEAILAGPPLFVVHRARNVAIINDGIINCARVAPRGILVRLGNNWEIRPGRIIAATLSGVQCGQSEMLPEKAFEIMIDGGHIENFRAPGDKDGANDPNSIGINLEAVTDSRVSRCVIMGYRIGARAATSSNSFTDVHPWTTAGFGPMKAGFENRGGDVKYINCTADGMTSLGDPAIGEVYGFLCHSPASIIGCTVMLNPDAGSLDNECVAIKADGIPEGRHVIVSGGLTIMSIGGKIAFRRLFEGSQDTLKIYGKPVVAGAFTDYGVLPVASGGGRQLAPNRDFSMWQRGQGPISCIGKGTKFLADRWFSETDGETGIRTMARAAVTRKQGDGLSSRFAVELEQRTAPSDGSYWALAMRLPFEDILALEGRTLNFSIYARWIGAAAPPEGLTFAVFVRTADGNKFGIAQAQPVQVRTDAWRRCFFRVRLPTLEEWRLDDGAHLDFRLLLPNAGVWKLQLAQPSLWEGDEWLEWTSPSREAVEAECFRYFEIVTVRTTSSAVWVPATVRKARPPSASTSFGVIETATESGVLLKADGSATATVTMDSEL